MNIPASVSDEDVGSVFMLARPLAWTLCAVMKLSNREIELSSFSLSYNAGLSEQLGPRCHSMIISFATFTPFYGFAEQVLLKLAIRSAIQFQR